MKKILIYGLFVVILLLSGCAEKELDEVPIYPDEVPWDITILETDSNGTVYMDGRYTNNTDYIITFYKLNILNKDTNDTTYMVNLDTMMPGDVSPRMGSVGPQSRDEDDYEVLSLEIIARLDDDNELTAEYDFRLDEVRWGIN